MNGYGKLRRMTDRDPAIVGFYLYLAAAFVTVRALIQRARRPLPLGHPADNQATQMTHQSPGALSRLDDRGVQAWPGLVGERDADVGEPGRLEQLSVLAAGQGAVGAADPVFPGKRYEDWTSSTPDTSLTDGTRRRGHRSCQRRAVPCCSVTASEWKLRADEASAITSPDLSHDLLVRMSVS